MPPQASEQKAISGKEQDMTARKNDRKAPRAAAWMLVLLPLVIAIAPAAAQNPSDYYTEPQVYATRPSPGREYDFGPIGVTGIEARIYPCLLYTSPSPRD